MGFDEQYVGQQPYFLRGPDVMSSYSYDSSLFVGGSTNHVGGPKSKGFTPNFASLLKSKGANLLKKVDEWTKRAELLKEDVKQMLTEARGKPKEIYLIDAFKRLGLGYKFEQELEDALQRIYTMETTDSSDNLYAVAVKFRVLREGGFNASAEVFNKFKDTQGKFKASLSRDVKALLSLYEAAFLGVQGEDILDEAIEFTKEHLKSLLLNLDTSLGKQVRRTLEIPTHKRLDRLNARYFISIYEESKECDERLIEYAKLDYNILQAVHQREIMSVSKWWKDTELAGKYSYARDRVVECYFWDMSVAFQPQFARTRLFAAKIMSIISLIDDTYDAYGVYEELKLFTYAIERWDIEAMDELPEYMRPLYHELITCVKEFEEEIAKEGISYQIGYMKEAMKDLCRSYLIEAEWFKTQYTPRIEEYMKISLITCVYPVISILSLVGSADVSIEIFEWLRSQSRIAVASAEIARFMDDIVSCKFEQERGHCKTSIECYMIERGMTEEDVCKLFDNFYVLAWKDMNQTCLKPTIFPMNILSRPVNFARAVHIMYAGNEDGYTFPGGRIKGIITSVLVDPIPL